MHYKFIDSHPLLPTSIAVAHSHSVFVLGCFFTKGVEVDDDTVRRADFVLAAVALADVAVVVPCHVAEFFFEQRKHLARLGDQLRLVFEEWRNGDAIRREVRAWPATLRARPHFFIA